MRTSWPAVPALALAAALTACGGGRQEPIARPPALSAPEPARFGTHAAVSQAADAPPAAKPQDRAAAPDAQPPRPAFNLNAKAESREALEQARRGPEPPRATPQAVAPVQPAGPPGECAPVAGVGCYLPRPGSDRLLIYMRGHLLGSLPKELKGVNKSRVPDQLLGASALQALDAYQLRQAADGLGASLLVTGSSHVSIDPAALAKAGVTVPAKVVVAVHSGAYDGFTRSLDALPPLEGLVLLDPFYGDWSAAGPKIAARIAGGMKCGGFYTPRLVNKKGKVLSDTAANYRRSFAPALGAAAPKCPVIESPSHSAGHADHILRVMR